MYYNPDHAMETFLRSLVMGSVMFIFGTLLIWTWQCCYSCAIDDSLKQQKMMVAHLQAVAIHTRPVQITAPGPPTQERTPPRATPAMEERIPAPGQQRRHAVIDQIQLELHPLLSLPPPTD